MTKINHSDPLLGSFDYHDEQIGHKICNVWLIFLVAQSPPLSSLDSLLISFWCQMVSVGEFQSLMEG